MSEPVQTLVKRGVKRWLRRRNWNVRRAARNLRLEQRIERINAAARPRLAALDSQRGLKLHLGCGPDIRSGWVNIDLNTARLATPFEQRTDGTIYINYDLRQGLPLQSECCSFIYSSHFFEHLEYECGVKLMEDCFRATEKGGTFRIVLPDMRALFKAYLGNDRDFFKLLDPLIAPETEPRTLTLIDYVNYGTYQFGEHKYIYDEEKLKKVLSDIGYSSVAASSFTPGLDVDTPARRKYSFYVEAKK